VKTEALSVFASAVLVFAGGGLVSFGLYLHHVPTGAIGVACIFLAFIVRP